MLDDTSATGKVFELWLQDDPIDKLVGEYFKSLWDISTIIHARYIGPPNIGQDKNRMFNLIHKLAYNFEKYPERKYVRPTHSQIFRLVRILEPKVLEIPEVEKVFFERLCDVYTWEIETVRLNRKLTTSASTQLLLRNLRAQRKREKNLQARVLLDKLIEYWEDITTYGF